MNYIDLKLSTSFIVCLLACLAFNVFAENQSDKTALSERFIISDGTPSGLSLDKDMLIYCDKRGEHKYNIKSGTDNAYETICPKNNEENSSCSGLKLDVAVTSSFSEPNDSIDIQGWIQHLDGRVHDCIADGNFIAITTNSKVILADANTESIKIISQKGGDRITINSDWIAWSSGSKIYFMTRNYSTK